MSITFNSIPLTINTPGAFIEFDASRAVKGLQLSPHDVVILAQKAASGSATANVPVLVRNANHAITLAGRHSMAAECVRAYKEVDSLTPVWLVPVSDDAGGTQATGSFVWTGTATEAGELVLYIGGRRVPVAVAVGASAASLETLALAALALVEDLPVTCAADAAAGVDVTAIHKGSCGNGIRLGVCLQAGETVPAGITVTVTQMSGGATDPSFTAAIAALGEDQYHTVIMGCNGSTGVAALVTELESRWGPMRAIEGQAFIAKAESQANLTTLGNSYNSWTLSLVGHELSALSRTPWEVAAQAAAISAAQTQVDPARETSGLPFVSMSAAHRGARFTRAERDTLLSDGVSTVKAASDGRMVVERLITTYQTNGNSIPDISLKDLYRVRTLAALRYTLRVRIGTKFARCKLTSDGEPIPAGQPMVSPSIIRSEILALFREWRELGWVENYAQFERELIVERDGSDPNRVNAIIPPDIINNFLVFAGQIAFGV